jgi:hypothetical protein
MPLATHAAARSTRQARGPYASGGQRNNSRTPFTDGQLTTLISRRHIISVDDMQDFLRRSRQTGKGEISTPPAPPTNPNGKLLAAIESQAYESFPDHADGIMEIAEILCNPRDLEFRPPIMTGERHNQKPDYDQTSYSSRSAVAWLKDASIEVVEMRPGYQIMAGKAKGKSLVKVVKERMFTDVITMLEQTSPKLVSLAKSLAYSHYLTISQNLGERLAQTGAFRYGLLEHRELNAIVLSAAAAFFPAVLFLANDDQARHATCQSFIRGQLGGHPIVEYDPATNTAYMLVAPVVEPHFVDC